MSILFTADLHQTDLPRDEYRWGLFPWMIKQIKKHDVREVILGGDVTDAKDKHTSALTNRLVDSIRSIASIIPTEVFWLRGNHDYVDEQLPFFKFLDGDKRIHFITEPTEWNMSVGKVLLLPNTRDYKTAWKGLDFTKPDFIFCHQSFDGCITETGFKLEGIPPSVFKGAHKVWSGDVHKEQKIGKNIEYVGAPYHIRFNDDFEPRVILIRDDGTEKSLHYPTLRKFTLTIVSDDPAKELRKELKRKEVRAGDQVKVVVSLERALYLQWPMISASIKETCAAFEVELFGPELKALQEAGTDKRQSTTGPRLGASPAKALADYAKREGLSGAMLKAGKAFLGTP